MDEFGSCVRSAALKTTGRQISPPKRGRTQLPIRLLLVVIGAVTLAGCNHAGRNPTGSGVAGTTSARSTAAPIRLPDQALLKRQTEPACSYKSTESKTDELKKLEFERQCYRHAEIIARHRLQQLQSAVDRSIKSAKQGGS